MAAIIRRHRFVTLVIICFLTFVTFCWQFHRKEKSISIKKTILHVHENFNDENQILEKDRTYTTGVFKISNNIDKEQPPLMKTHKLSKDERNELFIPLKTETEQTEYQNKELRYFIPTRLAADQFTTESMRQLQDKLVIGGEKTQTIPRMRNFEIEPSPLKIDTVEDAKYLYLKESPFAIRQSDKAVTLSQQAEDDFPVPDLANKLSKTAVTLTMPKYKSNTTTGLSNKHKNTTLNQQEFPKIQSIENKAYTPPIINHIENESSSPKKMDLKEQSDKAVTSLQQVEEDFPAPDIANGQTKTDVTFSMSRDRNNPTGLANKNKNTALNQQELPTIQSKEKKINSTPTIKHREKESTTPSKINIVEDTKYSDLKKISFTIQQAKNSVTISPLEQSEEDFPAPDIGYIREKTNVTLSLSRNSNHTIGLLNKNKNTVIKMLNQQKLSKVLPPSNSISTISALLIDTPGCKIPRLDPWDPTIKDLIELQNPYICPGPPVFMKSNPGGSITFNKTILETYYNITPEELNCHYEPIYRLHEQEGGDREINFRVGNMVQLLFGIPLNEDYVRASCNIKGKKYEQYFALVRLKENVEEERNSRVPPNPTLNVILLGIDSVSKLNFLRHFPRTHAFLHEKLKPFEMNGYTKVGDNTFPNLVSLLTGQFVQYWWNETVKDTMFFDDVGFIWKKYAKKGYRTFFAEDNPFAGTFNYIKRGFYDPPTDYYFRPMALAMEMWKYILKSEKEFCFNSQIDFDIIYDYLKVFTQTMESRPYFGFAMLSTITHDKLNNAGWADEPTERLLEGLLNTGAFNNTILVLFSDHGLRFGKIRYTYVGKFEERLPLMYIYVPKWFLDQYPEIDKNMQINQNRLMTLLDVHATMLHLLDLSKSQAQRSKVTLGRSLFEEISPNRTCSDAFIETHWCPCQTFDIVDLRSLEVINASQAIVNNINSKLEPYGGICEILEVDTIMDARVGKANEMLLQYLRSENEVINKTIYVGDEVTSLDDYMITLVTKPGAAIFEGTVRHNPDDNSYSVLGISRISMYGNTSWCIDSQTMKIFCYCNTQPLI